VVSVIVPVYNVEKFLPACIESILAQTYPDFELILVDDGSTDSSGCICDEFQKKDSRIRVIHKKNEGVCKARNVALDAMAGEYCILVDSDDVIHPRLLEIALNELRNTSLDMLIYGYEFVNEDFCYVGLDDILCGEKSEHYSIEETLKEAMLGRKFRMIAWNKLYKSSLWKNIRFPEGRTFGDDSAVTYRLIDACDSIAFLKCPLYYYRMRNGRALHADLCVKNLELFDSYYEMQGFIASKYPQLCSLAQYAYGVRLFDFFAKLRVQKINSKKNLLLELYKKILRQNPLIYKNKSLTFKQRILLFMFTKCPSFFWMFYLLLTR